MKHKLGLLKVSPFYRCRSFFPLQYRVQCFINLVLTCSWKSKRSVWSDRRAHPTQVMTKDPELTSALSKPVYSHGALQKGNEYWLRWGAEHPSDRFGSKELCPRRSLSLLQSPLRNRRLKSSLYREINGLSVSSFFLRPPCSWHP